MARTERCIECRPGDGHGQQAIDAGVAGGSAQRNYQHRKLSREARTKERFGRRLGGIILAVTDEPASTRAWARGAQGEQDLAKALAGVPSQPANAPTRPMDPRPQVGGV